jgi:TolB-like protein/Tfp pilus assembly protein PilF
MPESSGTANGRNEEMPSPEGSSSVREVFVSYASQNAATADSVVEVLERNGITCWVAPRDVIAGEFYADAIVHAIDASRVLVLILSQHAAASPHILREVERASARRHPVISLRIDRAPLPSGLEYFLNTCQWLDASNSETSRALPKLIEAVRRAQQGGSAHTATSAAARTPTESSSPPHRGKSLIAIISTLIAGAALALAVDKIWLSKHAAGAVKNAAPISAPTPSIASAAPGKSVAVLPFLDMSEKKDQEYFSDGMSEELIDMLAKIPDLRVPARTSSFYFKGKSTTIADIAKALGVSHVLEGSVRKSGNALRVTAQLIRADNGYHVWSETYDRQLDDVFKLQDEIAGAVVKALKVSMLASDLPQAPTQNAEAHSLLLQGRFFGRRNTKEDRVRAIDYYVRALALDPGSAQGWAWLSTAYTVQAVSGWSERDAGYALARQAAQRALLLDPNLADAHAALGYIYEAGDWNWAAADKELKRALALDPDNVRVLNMNGHLALNLGQSSTAEAFYRRAVDRDPLSPGAMGGLADALLGGGKRDEGERIFRQVASIAPPRIHLSLSLLALDRGDKEAALAEAELEPDPLFRLMAQCAVYNAIGERTAAEKTLAELTDRFPDHPFEIATVYGRRGEFDTAFAWMERALARRDSQLMYVKSDPNLYLTEPLLQSFRSDPRYKSLLRRMNLPP